MQPSSSELRNTEAVTEPSGHGPFAEAMRELIAELRPVRGPQLQLLRGRNTASAARGLRAHLQLVR